MTQTEASQLREGRRLALEHARRLLEAAKALAFDHPVGAVPLFYHGVEEVGKAALIERAITTGVRVNFRDLRDHVAKLREATKVMPHRLLLVRSGAFAPAIFDPTVFDVGELVDLASRRLYVDWASGGWRMPSAPNSAVLAASIDGVMQLIDGWLAGDPLIRD